MDIKSDKLTQDIHRLLREQSPLGRTATRIVEILFDTHAVDSNHKKYRRVLRRLNWLVDNGYVSLWRRNGYSPGVYKATK